MATSLICDVEDPECRGQNTLRRLLLARYLSDAFAPHDIPDQAVTEACEPGHPFRSWVRQQGIHPDTLTALTHTGAALLRTCTPARTGHLHRTAARDGMPPPFPTPFPR